MAGFWYGVLGLLLGAYFVLGGLDYGVGLVLPVLGGERERRSALAALGPFFLGNEVWIVAAAGVLLAAFPRAQADLFAGAYPLVVALVLGLLAVNAGVQLRSRPAGEPARRRFDLLVAVAALVLAAGWGLLLGHVVGGVPLLRPLPVAAALAGVAVAATHGCAYLVWRADDADVRATARRVGLRTAPAAAGLILVALGAAAVGGHAAGGPAVAGTALAVGTAGAAGLAWLALRADRRLPALAATAVAVVLPELLLGMSAAAQVTAAAAAPETLRLLGWAAAPVVPLLIALQGVNWWLFRPSTRPATRYW